MSPKLCGLLFSAEKYGSLIVTFSSRTDLNMHSILQSFRRLKLFTPKTMGNGNGKGHHQK